MGARLTFGLVLLAAATLVLGYAIHAPWLIYGSIGCSALAALGLLVSSRTRRERPEPNDDLSWPASLAEPAEANGGAPRPQPRPVVVARRTDFGDAAGSGAPRTDRASPAMARRRSSEPAPEPATGPATEPVRVPDLEPEPSYAAAVTRAPAPVASVASVAPVGPRPSRLRTEAPEVEPAPWVAPVAAPSPRPAAPAPRSVAPAAPPTPIRRRPVPPVDDYPFPIEDYEYLDVDEILLLLPELDDKELVEVLLVEQKGANRFAILDRIDALMEGEDW